LELKTVLKHYRVGVSGKPCEDVRSIAETYCKLRLQTEENIRRMRECSKKLFKAFLKYVEDKKKRAKLVSNSFCETS
jgi:hypothetical protein